MDVRSLKIAGLKVIRAEVLRDSRGYFCVTYNARELQEEGIDGDFVQDNQALSTDEGTVRGLHFQATPRAQDKLVRVVRGSVLAVAVDIRRCSPTYGEHATVVLSSNNGEQFWVPKGFAHGYRTLESDTVVLYKVTDYYAPDFDLGIAWDDPALGIDWRMTSKPPVVSDRDRRHPCLVDLPAYFMYSA